LAGDEVPDDGVANGLGEVSREKGAAVVKARRPADHLVRESHINRRRKASLRAVGLCRGDRGLTPQKHLLALDFAADFDEPFKPTDPIVRIGGDALRVEVPREFVLRHAASECT
jgi:hypothetical protein